MGRMAKDVLTVPYGRVLLFYPFEKQKGLQP
jgi:hypothetical protein